MKITEVRIKLMPSRNDNRLRAFCSITFDDCFVVHDLKIIEGHNGPFVAMPSRKMQSHCPKCRTKNYVCAVYCNDCGSRLEENQAAMDQEGRPNPYFDIAHPITTTCRDMIQLRVLAEHRVEQERAKQPGYVSRYDAIDADDDSRRTTVKRAAPNDNFGTGIF